MNTITSIGSFAPVQDDITQFDDNFAMTEPSLVQLPALDGGYSTYGDSAAPAPPGEVTFAFWIYPTGTPPHIQNTLDTWRALTRQGLLKMTAMFGGVARECYGFLNLNMPRDAKAQPHRRQNIRGTLRVPRPEWQAIADTATAISASGLSTTMSLAEIDGNLDAIPIFEVTTATGQTVTSIKIQRLVVGAVVDEVSYDAPMAANSTLIINCRNRTVTVNTVGAYADFEYLNPRWFRLPYGTVQNIRVLLGNAANECTVAVKYRARYV